MKRLTKRDEYGNADIIGVDSIDLQSNLAFEEFNKVTQALNRLAHYEDLAEQGRLGELPCKIGGTVYILHRRIDGSDCVREAEFWWSDIPQLGKTVFLTRTEAEAALKAMGERKGAGK